MTIKHCFVCDQELPEDTEEHPDYFMRYKPRHWEDRVECFSGEAHTILQRLDAVLGTITEEGHGHMPDRLHQLALLAGDLCKEARGRVERLIDAGQRVGPEVYRMPWTRQRLDPSAAKGLAPGAPEPDGESGGGSAGGVAQQESARGADCDVASPGRDP